MTAGKKPKPLRKNEKANRKPEARSHQKSSRGLQGHDLPISMEVNAGGMKMVEGEGDSRQEIKTTQKK